VNRIEQVTEWLSAEFGVAHAYPRHTAAHWAKKIAALYSQGTPQVEQNGYCILTCGQELPDKGSEICDSCIKQYQSEQPQQVVCPKAEECPSKHKSPHCTPHLQNSRCENTCEVRDKVLCDTGCIPVSQSPQQGK
jgi:hypothetical protein